MRRSRRSPELLHQINVTPFVDVMLVLMIVFMVTAPLMIQGVHVDLPRGNARPIVNPNPPVVITITQNKRILLNKSEVASGALPSAVQKALLVHPKSQVFLRADRGVAYGVVMSVMQSLRQQGIEHVSLIIRPIQP